MVCTRRRNNRSCVAPNRLTAAGLPLLCVLILEHTELRLDWQMQNVRFGDPVNQIQQLNEF
jgi:hypothetical protein